MAKITPYKFINPGIVGTSTIPVVRAASKQILASNRLGSVVEGIGHIVKNIVDNNGATIIWQKQQLENQKRADRVKLDQEAEAKQELAKSRLESQNKLDAKDKKKDIEDAGDEKGNGFLDWLENTIAPFFNIFKDIVMLTVGTAIFNYLADPANRDKIFTFVERFSFVLNKIYKFIENITQNTLEGFTKLFGAGNSFWTRLEGLGQMMGGIIALKYLMNPASLIEDVFSIVDALDTFFDKKQKDLGLDKDGKPQKPGTGPDGKPVKPGALKPDAADKFNYSKTGSDINRQHGPNARKAFDNAYKNAIDSGKNPSAATRTAKAKVDKLLKAGKLKSVPQATLSATANKAAGLTAGKSTIFGRGVDKATQRFFLKIIGKGGVEGLKKILNKIPIVGPLITFALNWAAGEPFLKSAVMAVGSGIGQLVGTWAGGALGALGGPAAPLTVPLGGLVGNILGSVGGELIGGWLYDTVTGRGGGINFGQIGKSLGAVVKKIVEADYGKLLGGAWNAMLNFLGETGKSAWKAISSMASFAAGKLGDMFNLLMESSKEWRDSVWTSIKKYVLDPLAFPKLSLEVMKTIGQQVIKMFLQSPAFMQKLFSKTLEAAQKFFKEVDWIDTARVFAVGSPQEKIEFITNVVKKTMGPAFQDLVNKGKEIGTAIITPIKNFLKPAWNTITKTWDIVSRFPGWVKENTIDPFFSAVSTVWNSGQKVWEWMNKENTFQDTFGGNVDTAKTIEELAAGGSFGVKTSKLLASYEGIRENAYPDAIYGWKVPTIGIGATYYPPGFRLSGKVKKGDKITKDEAYWIKSKHVAQFTGKVKSEVGSGVFEKLPDKVKAPLISKAFNYGSLGGGLSSKVKDGAKTENYSGVASYFKNTLASHDGGVNAWRRRDEAAVILTGKSPRANVTFGGGTSEIVEDDSILTDSSDSSSSSSAETSAPEKPAIPDNPAGAFEYLQNELGKLFGSDSEAKDAAKLSADEITKIAFDPNVNLANVSEIKKETIGNMEYSKVFSMNQNAPQFVPFPVAIGIAQPLVVPMPINSPAKVVTAQESPLTKTKGN